MNNKQATLRETSGILLTCLMKADATICLSHMHVFNKTKECTCNYDMTYTETTETIHFYLSLHGC